MKILFFAPSFFNYHKIICKCLQHRGYQVEEHLYPNSFLFKLLTTLLGADSGIVNYFKKYYFKNIWNRLDDDYNVILAIRASEMPLAFLSDLRGRYPNRDFVQYLWDDVILDPKSLDVMRFFDRNLSFNPNDCKEYNLEFRPFFYDNYEHLVTEKKNTDVVMFVSYKYNRFLFLKGLVNWLKKNHFTSIIIIRASIFLLYSKKEHIKYKKYFRSKAVPYEVMLKQLSSSKVCVEICHEKQTGMSTRQFEALYTRTKVITNNAHVREYDFYCPENIYVLDESHSLDDIPTEWVNAPYKNISESVLKYYSLDAFIDQLLAINLI